MQRGPTSSRKSTPLRSASMQSTKHRKSTLDPPSRSAKAKSNVDLQSIIECKTPPSRKSSGSIKSAKKPSWNFKSISPKSSR